VKRCIATVVAVAVISALGFAGTAGASGTDVCGLITKKEASKILGAKVVKLKRESDATTGAHQCTYKTKKYTAKRLKKFNAPLELKLLLAPVTQALRDEITQHASKFDPIPGLADEAYVVDNFDVLAIKNQDVVQASVYNWETGASVLEKKSERAVRLAVRRLPSG
jgi:hypothetical protein